MAILRNLANVDGLVENESCEDFNFLVSAIDKFSIAEVDGRSSINDEEDDVVGVGSK